MKVEIGQYKEVNKGALKGFFSLIIYPTGQKILDCRYFENENSSWFSFPQKEIKRADGGKSDFIPLISFMNKEYLEQLKSAVLTALKTQVNNARSQNRETLEDRTSNSGQARQVQSQSSFSWDGIAF